MRLNKFTFPCVLVVSLAVLTACEEDDDPTGPGNGDAEAVLSGTISTDRTLYADTVYTLSGFVLVADGATLTIEPGTTILGDYDAFGSSLFILRGAEIDAQGTADDPIVFTSSRDVGERQPGDWGGLVLVGNGVINRSGTITLEGTGGDNPTVNYSGGDDNSDSSGIMRYVRVEFAGYAISDGNELNSFTFAAVGSGTTLEYLQALAGLDDHFEFFGGAADLKYLVSYESGDDHFDMSEGYVGRIQHAIAFQTRILLPRVGAGSVSGDPQGIENDGCGSSSGGGCDDGFDSTPLTIPMVANFTLVGPPEGIFGGGSGGFGMQLRRGIGGYYVNGAVVRWENAAISLRDQATIDREDDGDLDLQSIYTSDVGETFFSGGASTQGSVDVGANAIVEDAEADLSVIFESVPGAPTTASQLDWTPADGSPLETGGTGAFTGDMATKAGTFVTGTTYVGAANPAGPAWWAGWTSYADN